MSFHSRIVVAAPDQSLDREDGVLRIRHRLPLCRLPDEYLAGAGESHHRGRRAGAFRVLDDLAGPTFHDGDARIRRSEVNPDHSGHPDPPLRDFRASAAVAGGQPQMRSAALGPLTIAPASAGDIDGHQGSRIRA